MIEVVKIILRVIIGAIPILWSFSFWMFLFKNRFEKMCAVLSFSLMCIGFIECLLSAIRF